MRIHSVCIQRVTGYENACRNNYVTKADSDKIYDREIDFGSDKMLCKMKCCHAWLIKATGKQGGVNLLCSLKRQKQAKETG